MARAGAGHAHFGERSHGPAPGVTVRRLVRDRTSLGEWLANRHTGGVVVPGAIIFAIVVAVGVATTATGWWALGKQTAESAREITTPNTAQEKTYLGGSLSSRWSASWPLARLEFFDWGIRLGGSVRMTRWLIRTWEARYEELATVRLVSSLTPGVRFAVQGSTDAVVFWTVKHSEEIADRLEAHSVRVDRSATSLRKAGGTHRTW